MGQGSSKRGCQTVVVNSGRPIGVVQEGSSNSGHEQWSSMNSGRQTVVVNSGRPIRGRPRGVVKQWP